uniref:CSON005088 protein n=1 Tax=Culicoides sonorensis TaxID=179676 RepID=A0A336KBU5_CULSO
MILTKSSPYGIKFVIQYSLAATYGLVRGHTSVTTLIRPSRIESIDCLGFFLYYQLKPNCNRIELSTELGVLFLKLFGIVMANNRIINDPFKVINQ